MLTLLPVLLWYHSNRLSYRGNLWEKKIKKIMPLGVDCDPLLKIKEKRQEGDVENVLPEPYQQAILLYVNIWGTMHYPKKPGFNQYQSRHCAYIIFSVKTWFKKNIFVVQAVWQFLVIFWFERFLHNPQSTFLNKNTYSLCTYSSLN